MTGNEAAPIRIGILSAAHIAPLALVNLANETSRSWSQRQWRAMPRVVDAIYNPLPKRLARQGDYHPFGLQMNKIRRESIALQGAPGLSG